MLKQTDTPETVRLSHSINDEEIKYVKERKTLIKKWLKGQGIDCELEDVPNIAFLGSGGGERAAVGMLGSLHQLGQDNLLGSLLYMCGVSGTTWCMSSLYSDPDWSLNKRCDEVIKMLKGPTVDLSKTVEWLKSRKALNQEFNLTDFWGAFTASYFMKEVSGVISDHFPTLLSVGVWFEMTPHESGFSGLGAFVSTSFLGSQFEGGTLTEKRKEMDMVLLQGGARTDTHRSTCTQPHTHANIPPHTHTHTHTNTHNFVPSVDIIVFFQNSYRLLIAVCLLLLGWWILQNISPLVQTWEWGTTSNFLFKVQGTIHLVDAALKINSPYPSVLRTSRKVDLIISLDFSEEDPFETVFSAKQYADELKLPFPPVKESVREEKDHPQDCYVFEGRHPEEPTVMHMPLFNLQNCQGVW
uniref:Cytosolic phospholipase A2 zeta n=1 Tax=Oncorhynchus kisutch TaxID=8019 RepID=A0A8C7K3F1_ONCKI